MRSPVQLAALVASFTVAAPAFWPASFWPVGAKDGTIALSYVGDSIRLYVSTASGPFTFQADSFAIASWAEAAASLRPPTPKASRVTFYDALLKTNETFDLIRVSDDSASAYQLAATIGAWRGAVTLAFDSARRLFTLMHGRPQVASTPPDTTRTTYFNFQVEKQAGPVRGSAVPLYPVPAKVAGLEGKVLAQFVVDTTGLVDLTTFKILHATNPWFVAAIYEALPWMKFLPAQVHGKNVRELVQEPYAFNLH
jgi:hypothetical protein